MLKTISSITNALGALNYKGTWNASSNTPTLADGTGAKGDYYVVSTAGTQTFGGVQLFFGLGDWIAYNGAVWQRVEGGSDGNFANVTLTSTDAGATASPLLELYRDSASPAASDTLGEIEFNGEDSAGNKQAYGLIHASILSPTSTTEQGQLHFETATAGALTEKMIIGTSNLVINEIGAVFNVRIEGDTDANLFYTDATNSRVGIGKTNPATKLDVDGTITSTGVANSALTTGRVTYATTGGLLTDSSTLVYDTSGNFGVGTASPSTYGRLVCLNTAGGAYAIAAVGNDQSNVRIRTKNTGGGGGDFTIVGGNPGIGNGGLAIFDETAAATRLYINSSGSVSIAGALSKGSGSFRIDHPLPQLEETHQLVHSFIEGPQADLIYRGKVNLVNGIASINIDTASTMTEGTFVALCRDVQCFTTNESGWNHVRGSVIGNVLTIECQDQTASDLISWMVIGERQDKHMMNTEWTDDNGRVIVEPIKVVETYTGIIKD